MNADEVRDDVSELHSERGAHRNSCDIASQKSILRKAPSTRVERVSFDEQPACGGSNHEAHTNHRAGNEVAMKKIVDMLYDKVLHNEKLAPFFKDFDIKQIKSQQEKVMALIFGGRDLLQADFPEFDMRQIHLRPIMEMGLSIEHWELFVNHFQECLNELDHSIPPETRASAIVWMRSTKDAFRPLDAQEVEMYYSRKQDGSAGAGKCPF